MLEKIELSSPAPRQRAFRNSRIVAADKAEAHSNRGDVLRELNHFREALTSCDRAIRLRADYADGIPIGPTCRMRSSVSLRRSPATTGRSDCG
jgi:hypothetical protein